MPKLTNPNPNPNPNCGGLCECPNLLGNVVKHKYTPPEDMVNEDGILLDNMGEEVPSAETFEPLRETRTPPGSVSNEEGTTGDKALLEEGDEEATPPTVPGLIMDALCPSCEMTENGKSMFETYSEMAGMAGGVCGEDAEWLQMNDPRSGECYGRVLMSIEIVPKPISEQHPNGMGRAEPNLHPFLPQPVGRMHFSLNPFYIMYECCGPKLFMQGCCISCCMLVFYLWIQLCSANFIDCSAD